MKKILIFMLKCALKQMAIMDGHETAKVLSSEFSESELQFMSATFKEAEIRRKESRIGGNSYA